MASDALLTPTEIQDASLLGLPAELRNSIYTYVLHGNAPTVLHASKIHPLLQVCRQTRAEAMAAYFAETQFVALCGADFGVRKLSRTGGRNPGNGLHSHKAGKMLTKPHMKKLINQAGNSAVFEMVVFNIYSTRNLIHQKRDRNSLCVAGIEMEYREGKAEIQRSLGRSYPGSDSRGGRWVSLNPNHTYRPPTSNLAFDAQDVDAAVHEGMQEAREIANRDDFKGWKYQDLQEIAKAMRYRRS